MKTGFTLVRNCTAQKRSCFWIPKKSSFTLVRNCTAQKRYKN
ncbi:hypothetical protein [Mesomycoplasma ovipneumoniae]